MGKSKGKILFSIAGFFLGAGVAGQNFFHLTGKALQAGLYGMNLASTLWSITNPIKPPSYSTETPFDQYMNEVSSDAVIPVVYGTRKVGGLQTYHQTSSDSKTLTKDVLLAEGEIASIYGATANSLLISQGPVFSIHNSLYEDATIEISNKKLKLKANGTTAEIALLDQNSLKADGSNDYSCTISKLIQYLTEYGYSNGLKAKGWVISNAVHVESAPNKILQVANTTTVTDSEGNETILYSGKNCYHNPIAVETTGLPSCSYVFKSGAKDQAPPENYLKTGSYKNMAYVRATLKQSDQLQGGNPTITAIAKGSKVWVYRDNRWQFEWSNNPAWIVRDYLLNKRYGLGRWIDATMLDEAAFRETADYCDQLISFKDVDGKIRQEKRLQLDIALTEKKNAIENLQDMFANIGGFLVLANNKISLRIEKPTAASYHFSDDTIVRDSVSFTQTSLEDTPNKYIIKYIDPLANWTAIPVLIEDTVEQEERGKIIEKDIELKGTIRQTQAKRIGNLNKNLNKLCSLIIEFSTGTYAAHLEPGDVVTVSYRNYFSSKPFRIVEIQEQKGVYEIKAREYNASVYDDDYLAEIEVKNYTNLPNAMTDTIPDVSEIQLTQTFYKQRDGTIVSDIAGACTLPNYPYLNKVAVYYSIDNGNTWVFYGDTANEHFVIHNARTMTAYSVKLVVENSVGRRSEGAVSQSIFVTGKDNPPANVTGLLAAIDPLDCTKVNLKWDKAEDVDLNRYSLRYGPVWESGTVISDTIFDNQYTFVMPASGTYSFMVCAADNSNNYSNTPASVLVTQKVEPADVAGFSIAVQETDRSRLLLTWEPNSEKDISYYEIRQGADWDSAQIIATQLKATSFLYQLSAEGSQAYLIKAVNLAGHSSVNDAVQIKQVILRPDAPANLAAIQDIRDSSILKLTWSASPGKDIDSYEIRRGTIWDTAEQIDITRETSYRYTIADSGNFTIMIRAKTVAGYLSNVANLFVSAMVEAYDVSGFTAVQSIADRTKVRLMWDNPISLDVAYHEIREGISWDAGTVINKRVTGTFYETTISKEGKHIYWIKAVTVAGRYSRNAVQYDGIFSLRPKAVTNIQLMQDINDKSLVNITYEATSESDLANYELRVGYVWEDAVKIGETKEVHWTYRPEKTGDVKIMVKALNAAGYYSDEASARLYVTLEPANVSGFRIFQNGEKLAFIWDKVPENDVVGYELREGSNFDNGVVIATGITLTQYQLAVDTEILRRFHIKAMNRSGCYSRLAATATIAVTDLPPKNVIETFDEIELQTGVHTGTEFGPSLITFATLQGRFSDYPDTKFSDIGGATVLTLAKKNGHYQETGTYTCARKDIGQVITANISSVFQPSVLYAAGTAAGLEYRLSRDNMTWTDWQPFQPLEATFRYADFRVVLVTQDTTKTPEVNQLMIRMDVPDKDIARTVTVPVGGVTASYGYTFYEVPVVTPTAEGISSRATWSAKTKSDVRLQVFSTTTGADTGGIVDLRVKGY